jgi:DNA-binding transcriptional ArsR family regulator
MQEDDVYRAIADPTRRAILDELTDRGGQSLFELCTRLIMKHGISSSRQAISQHLELLEKAGLVVTKREGRSKLHWFDGKPLEAVVERWPVARNPGRKTSGKTGRKRRKES